MMMIEPLFEVRSFTERRLLKISPVPKVRSAGSPVRADAVQAQSRDGAHARRHLTRRARDAMRAVRERSVEQLLLD